MNQAAQQISSNPARDFANAILAETNNALDLIELLHEISRGNYDANLNDRISAANTLMDRGFGKCPKSTPVLSPVEGPASSPNPGEPVLSSVEGTDDIDEGEIRESHPATPHEGAQSPRLVTQLDDSLHDSLGPPPSTHTPSTHSPGEPDPYPMQDGSPGPFDPFSIQSSIQDYILTITNNGQTLRTTLMEIAFADPGDASVIPYHRRRAATLLIDRALGTDPSRVHNTVCPECRRRWTAHAGSPAHPEHSHVEGAGESQDADKEAFDKEVWEGIIADLRRLEEENNLDPNRPVPKIDMSIYRMPKDFDITPYAAEEAAAFRAEIALRVERRKQWPEIEERRRKKLARIYPSHSDGGPPDT